MKSLIKTSGIAFFFLALATVPFAAPLFFGTGTLQWDAREVHLTNLAFSSSIWHAGFLPLWTPYLFGGFPQIADMQVAVFYPLDFLLGLFSVFTPVLLLWQIVLHFALAGFGMFLLVRYVTKNRWAGAFSGVAYMFSGFMIGHSSHIGMLDTAAWLPVVLLLLVFGLEKESYLWAVGTGLAAGVAILAGHFQISVFMLLTLGLYFLYDLSLSWYQTRTVPVRKLLLFSCMALIAFLIASVQLIPTLELARQSERAAISLELAQTESLNPQSLHALFDVNYNGVAFGPYTGPWDRTENYLFLGITTLGFALAALLSRVRRPRSGGLVWFFTFLAVIALLYAFGKFGFLQQYFYLLPIFNKMRAPSNMMILFDLSVIILAGIGFATIEQIFPRFKIFGMVAIAVLIAELMLPAALTDLTYARTNPNTIFEKPWIASTILSEEGHIPNPNDRFRVWRVPDLERNLAQVFRIYDFGGYNPLALSRQAAFEDAMAKNPALVDLASIKYLPCTLIPSRAARLQKAGDVCINEEYFPHAFLVDQYRIVKNENEVLPLMEQTDLKRTVVLESDPGMTQNSNPPEQGITENPSDNPNILTFDVQTDRQVLLVVSDAYYPGWIAQVDGRAAPVLQADYLFRAVVIPEGSHRIVFRFTAPSLKTGLLFSTLGIVLSALIMFLSVRKSRRDRSYAKLVHKA